MTLAIAQTGHAAGLAVSQDGITWVPVKTDSGAYIYVKIDTALAVTQSDPALLKATVTAAAAFPVTDNSGSLTVDQSDPANLKATVTAAAAFPVTDNSGSLTVDQGTPANLQATVTPVTDFPVENRVKSGSTWYDESGDTSGRPNVNLFGWDGAAARKLPMLFGYTARYQEQIPYVVAGGVNIISFTVVPAGEVWVLENLSGLEANRATAMYLVMIPSGSAAQFVLNYNTTQPAGAYLFWNGRMTMAAGDKVALVASGAQNGDTMIGSAWGVKMKIDQ